MNGAMSKAARRGEHPKGKGKGSQIDKSPSGKPKPKKGMHLNMHEKLGDGKKAEMEPKMKESKTKSIKPAPKKGMKSKSMKGY